ncbi:hypothetical protein [Ramlibacter albus]|uniref:Uncharacterized protein n=1 Tax=Ramlibacter albus TaxID=2079448 RepID=A0A923M9H0_9BURK|nr:hypothetical protein [Ramlibacter albus]MBC5765224.1 hypothetical protein [Ramlibacter albus]
MIGNDSPLVRLPSRTGARQKLFVDGIRHAAEIADVAYHRLAGLLTTLATQPEAESTEGNHSYTEEVYPQIDVDAYSQKVDVMVGEARVLVSRYARQGDPESIIRVLNTYLYKVYKIKYDQSPEARSLAAMWIRKAWQQSDPETVERYRRIAYSYRAKAEEMGWTRDPDANTMRKS